MVTIKNLSEILNLDISTISRALRNDPRVKETTKKRVNELAKSMGYKPNLAARSLVKGETRTFWFILPIMNDPVEIQVPQYVSQMLAAKDYDILVAIHHNDPMIYERILNRLNQGVADGAFILPDYKNEKCPIVNELVSTNFPIVFIDRYPDDLQTSVVSTDNKGCAAQLVDEASKNGCEYFLPLFTQRYYNLVEDKRLKGAIEQIEKTGKKYTTDFQSLSEYEKFNLPQNICIMASMELSVREFIIKYKQYFINKNLVFSVFDSWEGEKQEAKKIIVCIQDLEKISKMAVENLLHKVKNNLSNKREVIDIPAKEYLIF